MKIDLTLNEYNRMKAMHRNIGYTRDELEFLLQIADRNIEGKHRLCFTCSASISTFKQKIYSWFLNNEDEIFEFVNKPAISEFEKAKQEVNNYSKDDEK